MCEWEGRREVMVTAMSCHAVRRIYEWATEVLASQSEITWNQVSVNPKPWPLGKRAEGAFLITWSSFYWKLDNPLKVTQRVVWQCQTRNKPTFSPSLQDNSHIPDGPGYKITGATAVNVSWTDVTGSPALWPMLVLLVKGASLTPGGVKPAPGGFLQIS